MARAMRASGDRNPKAMRVRSRILVFTVIWSPWRNRCVEQGVGVSDMSLRESGEKSALLAKGARNLIA